MNKSRLCSHVTPILPEAHVLNYPLAQLDNNILTHNSCLEMKQAPKVLVHLVQSYVIQCGTRHGRV